jgi:hypothetical protein
MRPIPQPHHKPVTNPTSTKATIYEYTTIGLVVLIHLLDDRPRHIRYREALRKNVDVSGERREVVDRGGERRTRVFTPSGPHIDRGDDSGRERRGRTPPPNIHTQTTSSYRTEERRPRTPPLPPPPRRTTSSHPILRPSLYYLAARPPPPERTRTANINTSRASQYSRPRSPVPNKEQPQERKRRTPPSPPPARRTNPPRRSSSPVPPSYFIRHVRPSTPSQPQPANTRSSLPRHPYPRASSPHRTSRPPSPPLPSAFRTRRSSTPDQPLRPPTSGERREAWTRIRSVTPST